MSVWKNCPAIERDPEKVSGAWVLCGTGIPTASLFENLRDGATVDLSVFRHALRDLPTESS